MLSFQNQFYVIYQAFFFGCFLEVVYELHSSFAFLFGLRSTKVRHISAKCSAKNNCLIRKIAVSVWDFFYFVSVSPLCAVFLFGVNNGIVRWYIVLSTAMGFVAFKLTSGRILNILLDFFMYLFKEYILVKPLVQLKRVFKTVKIRKKPQKECERRVLYSINRKQG